MAGWLNRAAHGMTGFLTFLLLVAAMGLSIFLSLPVILAKGMRSRTIVFLNAAAIGILVFLLADIFSDVAPLLAGSTDYLTVPRLDLVFVVSVAGVFALLYLIDQRRPSATPEGSAPAPYREGSPTRLALIIACGIGLQNLTEGLVFGAAWSAGAVGLLEVIFVGFFLQNVTEGFPIVSPFLGERNYDLGRVAGLFLLGGVPTIVGGAIGYFYTNVTLDVLFDSLAIGAILYVMVPMLKVAFRPEGTPLESYLKQRLVYFGLVTGFVVGFLVNAF
jgi:zinc transporter, ZIP family